MIVQEAGGSQIPSSTLVSHVTPSFPLGHKPKLYSQEKVEQEESELEKTLQLRVKVLISWEKRGAG